MKSLMLKLLMIALSVNTLFANSIETKILKFLSKSVSATKSYKVKNISIAGQQDIKSIPGWKVFFVKVDLDLVGKNKSITITDKIFTNGNVVTKDFVDINTVKSIKNSFSPDFDKKFYDEKNIIAGNSDATNKLAVFSDPMCPFCMSFLPEVIEFVQKHPKQFILYYYHFPLNIHPNAPTLVKAILAAKKLGFKDVEKKVYEEVFDFETKDDKLVLDTFNKLIGTKLTLKELEQEDIIKHMEADMKIVEALMLNGTPRLFVNEKLDNTRKKYKNLLKR
ncbi:DsbA family protein [Sulfurospirillum arcachonense]|uniref:DsbA family protein n=1 Tax=Sulfurospirillum arcachonense TaxID=57666 RepID=UPI00046807F0|nr:DsbA family protein [Sulfurospirillum arcachonense]